MRVQFRTERTIATYPALADGAAFTGVAQDSAELHAPFVSPPRDLAAYADYVRRTRGRDQFGFLVRSAVASGRLVGVVNINNVVRGALCSGYLGYYAFNGMTGQGLMTEALQATVEHAFTKLGLHRLEANIQPENVASIRLARRCGFAKEGFSPAYLYIDGEWRDHERWAIVKAPSPD